MRPFTFRLTDLLGWVLALALGLGLFRFFDGELALLSYFGMPRIMSMLAFSESIFVSFVVTQAVMLVREVAHGRGPESWGPGRWMWSVAALSLFLQIAFFSIARLILIHRQKLRIPSAKEFLWLLFYERHLEYHREFAYFLVAFLLTSRKAGVPSALFSDARESSGRILVVIVVLTALFWRMAF